MPEKKTDRYQEIVDRLAELDRTAIENQKAKDSAIAAYRKKQKPINDEVTKLNKELVAVIKADPARARLYQATGSR